MADINETNSKDFDLTLSSSNDPITGDIPVMVEQIPNMDEQIPNKDVHIPNKEEVVPNMDEGIPNRDKEVPNDNYVNENIAKSPLSAAENYAEVASTVFDSPHGISEDKNKPDVGTTPPMDDGGENHLGAKDSDDALEIDETHNKMKSAEEIVPSVENDDRGKGNAVSSEEIDENVPDQNETNALESEKMIDENVDNLTENEKKNEKKDDENVDTSTEMEKNDAENIDNSNETEMNLANSNETDHSHEQQNVPIPTIVETPDDVEDNSKILVSDDKVSENNDGLSEEEIIQKLQDVNQDMYLNNEEETSDKQTEGTLQNSNSNQDISENIDEGADAGADNNTVSTVNVAGDGNAQDAVPSTGEVDEGISVTGGGDALDDANDIPQGNTAIQQQQHHQLNNEGLDAAPDYSDNAQDAEHMEQVYRDFARQEQLEQEAAIIEQQKAAIMRQQQHVTYADSPEGALTSNDQVSISKHQGHHQHLRGQATQRTPSRMSSITNKSVHIPQIPSPPASVKASEERRASTRNSQKLPPSLMRMSTVMVSARKRAVLNRQASTYFEDRQATKLVTLDECINSRPPLPFDLDGPGPFHYSPTNKPLYETNAPEYSMGRKFYERDGGGRTAWAKTWYNSPDNFTRKVRWDKRWPSPTHYSAKSPLLGRPQQGFKSYPQFSIGVRSDFSINKRGSEYEPSPSQYNPGRADNLVMRSAPSFSMAIRHSQTTLGTLIEKTPSPNKYSPKYKHMSSHVHYPSFTIKGIRTDKRHALGPHATL